MVLRGAFLQVAIGAGRAIIAQLHAVKPYDPVMLASAALLLGFAALIAAVIPARRAAGVDPMKALRAE
jgi:putative ABC transport system permease protein